MSAYRHEDDLEIKNFYRTPRLKSRRRRFAFAFWILLLVLILVGVGSILVYKTGFTFSQMNVKNNILPLSEDEPTPSPDKDRINILVLGLRGEDDPINGGLLTDTIMVISIKKETGQIALISIPRDLYVTMPGENYKDKINAAYALGFEKRQDAGGGLLYSKIAISRVTGLPINYTVAVNFAALKEIVDILGGIDISLNNAFIEDQQWIMGGDAGPSSAFYIQTTIATSSISTSTIPNSSSTSSTTSTPQEIQKWVFKIPAGNSHLDGNTTLYYMRARFSSNDFDRALRQQQVLVATKDKALSLGILANPLKVYELLGSLGRNIRTDIALGDIKELVGYAQNVNDKKIIRRFFDTSPEGLLYQTRDEKNLYILLPQGDNFDKIQEACRNIFN